MRRIDMLDRLSDKFTVGDGCWEWTGGRAGRKYGQFRPGGREGQVLAHRFVYELLRGPIPEGLTIDHLCRNGFCVNPGHMEPVTIQVNNQRRDMAKAAS